MVHDEISRIKAAEAEALKRIAHAQEEVERIRAGALADAESIIRKAAGDAQKEGERMREKRVGEAEFEAERIRREGAVQVDRLRNVGTENMEKAVLYVLNQVKGEERVLSGRDVQGDHRDS